MSEWSTRFAVRVLLGYWCVWMLACRVMMEPSTSLDDVCRANARRLACEFPARPGLEGHVMQIVSSATVTDALASMNDVPVAIVHWPEELDRDSALAREGRLRLLLVAPAGAPRPSGTPSRIGFGCPPSTRTSGVASPGSDDESASFPFPGSTSTASSGATRRGCASRRPRRDSSRCCSRSPAACAAATAWRAWMARRSGQRALGRCLRQADAAPHRAARSRDPHGASAGLLPRGGVNSGLRREQTSDHDRDGSVGCVGAHRDRCRRNVDGRRCDGRRRRSSRGRSGRRPTMSAPGSRPRSRACSSTTT